MPHPMTKAGNIRSGPGTVLERPELAAMIAAIAAEWSFTEMYLGMFLAELLDVHANDAMPMYLKLNTFRQKREVIEAIAINRLKDDDFAAFSKLMERIKRGEQRRSKVIHGIWGASTSYPNALILINSTDWIRDQSEIISQKSDINSSGRVIKYDKAILDGKVWIARDFQDIVDAILSDRRELFTFLESKSLIPLQFPHPPREW